MLAARRLRAHAAVFGAVFAVVAVLAGASAGLAGYLLDATASGVRAALAAAPGSEGAVRIETRAASTADSADQDAAVRRILADQFPGVPLLVDRTEQTEPLTVTVSRGSTDDTEPEEVRLVVGALAPTAEGFRERAALVSGSWATGPEEGVLQDDAARALGLTPGDTLTLPDGTTLTVTGTWLPRDALDPWWFGDPLVATGAAGDAAGPLVTDEATLAELRPFARWTVRPDPERVEADDLPTIVSGVAALRTAFADADDVSTGNVLIDGGLGALAQSLAGSAAALSGVAPVPAILLATIGFVTLREIARLLVRVRATETAVLRVRGASAAWITATTALEAAAIAVPASALGVGAAALATGAAVWPIGVAVAAVAALVLAVVAGLDARRPLRRDSGLETGRAGRAVGIAGIVGVVLVSVAAVVSVWQFRLYGSPVIRGADGRVAVDPLAVLAPTLTLLAGALIVVALLAPGTRALASLTRRATVGWALTGWQLARRVGVFATPVLLVALAVGGTVVAAAYSATWDRATGIARETGTGAAVRVTTAWPFPALDGTPGVEAAAPALSASVQAGDDPVRLIALPADAIARVVLPVAGVVDPAALAAAVAAPVAVPLPAGAVVEVTDDAGRALDAAVSFVGDDGRVVREPAPAVVPDGRWGLAALDVPMPTSASGAPDASPLTVTARTGTDEEPIDVGAWVVAPGADADAPRLVPPSALSLPVVVSQSFADRGGVGVGDDVTLRFDGAGRHVVGTIAAVVPVIPGAATQLGVLADLPGFSAQQLALASTVPPSNEVWIASDAPAEVAAALAAPGLRIATDASRPEDVLLAAGSGALWIGAAGSLLLALVAVGAVAGALLRDRTGEVVVLRVLGSTSRDQARSRARELAVVLAGALVGGVVVGSLVTVLTVTDLARSAVLGADPAVSTVVRVDILALAVVLGAAELALAGITVAYGRRVASQARTLAPREDAR